MPGDDEPAPMLSVEDLQDEAETEKRRQEARRLAQAVGQRRAARQAQRLGKSAYGAYLGGLLLDKGGR